MAVARRRRLAARTLPAAPRRRRRARPARPARLAAAAAALLGRLLGQFLAVPPRAAAGVGLAGDSLGSALGRPGSRGSARSAEAEVRETLGRPRRWSGGGTRELDLVVIPEEVQSQVNTPAAQRRGGSEEPPSPADEAAPPPLRALASAAVAPEEGEGSPAPGGSSVALPGVRGRLSRSDSSDTRLLPLSLGDTQDKGLVGQGLRDAARSPGKGSATGSAPSRWSELAEMATQSKASAYTMTSSDRGGDRRRRA
ncbi:unnamed protein product [Prorocentrum cordatum]|uniref:Uncharacterized protein n=1 Tax=Prorocentrum cordatum TaxID=2364126 RepID=A0ABN9SKG9_9DINO|nr:unnamed protein product [Polarella glacialis]